MIIKCKDDKKIIAQEGRIYIGFIDYVYEEDKAHIDTIQLLMRNIGISLIWTHPKHRRKGIATKMLQYLFEIKPNIVWFCLWTGKEIEELGGTNLYLKNGFKRLVYHEDYYEKGVGVSYFARRGNGKA